MQKWPTYGQKCDFQYGGRRHLGFWLGDLILCDFLLVINGNFGPILHRFRVTATYWLKVAYFSYPTLICALAPYVPFGISRQS